MSQRLKTDLTTHRNALLIKGSSAQQRLQSAQRLAGSLGKNLVRVDLSAVVSKYIAETEKNLRRVLDQAERRGSILFLDEADALFGKRTNVRDAHDRYANQENQPYRISIHDSGSTVLIGTGHSGEALARSRPAIPLQFKSSKSAVATRRLLKWPP